MSTLTWKECAGNLVICSDYLYWIGSHIRQGGIVYDQFHVFSVHYFLVSPIPVWVDFLTLRSTPDIRRIVCWVSLHLTKVEGHTFETLEPEMPKLLLDGPLPSNLPQSVHRISWITDQTQCWYKTYLKITERCSSSSTLIFNCLLLRTFPGHSLLFACVVIISWLIFNLWNSHFARVDAGVFNLDVFHNKHLGDVELVLVLWMSRHIQFRFKHSVIPSRVVPFKQDSLKHPGKIFMVIFFQRIANIRFITIYVASCSNEKLCMDFAVPSWWKKDHSPVMIFANLYSTIHAKSRPDHRIRCRHIRDPEQIKWRHRMRSRRYGTLEWEGSSSRRCWVSGREQSAAAPNPPLEGWWEECQGSINFGQDIAHLSRPWSNGWVALSFLFVRRCPAMVTSPPPPLLLPLDPQTHTFSESLW